MSHPIKHIHVQISLFYTCFIKISYSILFQLRKDEFWSTLDSRNTKKLKTKITILFLMKNNKKSGIWFLVYVFGFSNPTDRTNMWVKLAFEKVWKNLDKIEIIFLIKGHGRTSSIFSNSLFFRQLSFWQIFVRTFHILKYNNIK